MSITPTTNCMQCDGTGWRPIEGVPERTVRRCECRGDARALRLKAVLPPLYQAARLTDFHPPLRETVDHWLAQPDKDKLGLFLTGPVGTGKTWLCAAVARALIESGKQVIFKTAADYFLDLRTAYSSTEPDCGEHVILDRLSGVDYLVLDDVGAGSLSDHERRTTLHLVERRREFLRPTIVSSNLTLNQIGELLDKRIASRLGDFTRLNMVGRDRRRK